MLLKICLSPTTLLLTEDAAYNAQPGVKALYWQLCSSSDSQEKIKQKHLFYLSAINFFLLVSNNMISPRLALLLLLVLVLPGLAWLWRAMFFVLGILAFLLFEV